MTLTGAFLITLALLLYGIGSISIQRLKTISYGVLIFLTLGVIIDLLAVSMMILGARGKVFTMHGLLGYTATFTMIINLILVWHAYFKNGLRSEIEKRLLTYSKYAYGWWVITYITGSLLILWVKI